MQLNSEERVVAVNRTKVVKGGRRLRFAALFFVVVGDHNGRGGIW